MAAKLLWLYNFQFTWGLKLLKREKTLPFFRLVAHVQYYSLGGIPQTLQLTFVVAVYLRDVAAYHSSLSPQVALGIARVPPKTYH